MTIPWVETRQNVELILLKWLTLSLMLQMLLDYVDTVAESFITLDCGQLRLLWGFFFCSFGHLDYVVDSIGVCLGELWLVTGSSIALLERTVEELSNRHQMLAGNSYEKAWHTSMATVLCQAEEKTNQTCPLSIWWIMLLSTYPAVYKRGKKGGWNNQRLPRRVDDIRHVTVLLFCSIKRNRNLPTDHFLFLL